jgi:polar amino acid transport system substrate-binding protein
MFNVKSILLITTFFFISINITYAYELKLVTLQYPPYEFENDGKIEGVAVEIVKEIFNRMNQPINIELLPWSRALKLIETGDADGIFTIYKTPERELFAEFSSEILIPQTISLFVLWDSNINFNGDLAKLNEYKFGVVRGVSYGKKFDEALEKNIIKNIEEVNIGEQNFMKLLSSRVDIVISNKYGAEYIINQIGYSRQIKELYPEVETLPSYIAFSKKRNLSAIKKEFDKILKEMKSDGSYDKIINDYFKLEK